MKPLDRSPSLTILRQLPRVSRGLSVALAGLIASSAALPIGFILATGLAIRALRRAAEGGFDATTTRTFSVAIGLLAGLYFVKQLLLPTRDAVADALGFRLDGYLRDAVMGATLAPVGIRHLEDPTVSERISVSQGIVGGWIAPGEAVRSATVVVASRLEGLGAGLLLAAYQWWAPLVLLLAWWWTHRWLATEVATIYRSRQELTPELRRSAYFRDLALGSSAAKELRVFGLADWVADRFRALWTTGMGAAWQDRRGYRGLMILSMTALLAGYTLVFVALSVSAGAEHITVEALAVYVQAALSMAAFGYLNDEWWARYSAGAIPEAVELKSRLASVSDVPTSIKPQTALVEEGIRFSGVSFSYPGQEREVLDDVCLWIPAGSSLAIVGENGAGKTTMVKLLARLYEVDGGAISVDGLDIRNLDAVTWRRGLAVIFQDYVRYELSARLNVGFGCVELLGDSNGLEEAAAAFGVLDLIRDLPNGWDTVLSRKHEGGADLSAGEWQRIALARAMFAVHGGARVLILDEPTANLDVRSEAALYERFLSLTAGLTTILISHRFSTVRLAERICVLDTGRVVELGAHDELIRSGGPYAQMYYKQASRYAADAGPST